MGIWKAPCTNGLIDPNDIDAKENAILLGRAPGYQKIMIDAGIRRAIRVLDEE